MSIIKLIISIPLCILITATLGFWITYLSRKMINCYKRVREINHKIKYGHLCEMTIYIQLKDVNKSWFIKYIFMLAITVTESTGLSTMLLYFMIPNGELLLEYYDNEQVKFNICEGTNESTWSYIELSHYQNYPFTNTLLISTNAAMILSSALGICLTKLISAQFKFHNSWDKVKHYIIKLLIITAVLSVLSLLLSAVSYTRLISNAFISILLLVYMVMFLKSIKYLKNAIQQYARERLIQVRKNKSELLQLRNFKISSSILIIQCISGMTLVLFEEIKFVTYFFLYFGKCYIPLVYGITYQPILSDPDQLLILFKADYYLVRIQICLAAWFSLIFGIPYTVVTVIVSGSLVYRRMMRRITVPVRYGYTSVD